MSRSETQEKMSATNLDWDDMERELPSGAIKAIDNAMGDLASDYVNHPITSETSYLASEGMTFAVLLALREAGYTIVKSDQP